jgi:hypothetical protein
MSETTGKPKRDWYSIFLSTISLALAVLVVLLVLQNRDLKAQLRGPVGLAAGETLPSFALVDSAGAPVQIPLGDGQPRLLLVFTSTCPHCTHAMPIWRDLVRDGGNRMEVLGVQLDAGTANAQPIDTLPFPVLAPGSVPPEFLSKLTGVPCSIVVDGTGKIETLFYGPPDGSNLEQLRDALKVS